MKKVKSRRQRKGHALLMLKILMAIAPSDTVQILVRIASGRKDPIATVQILVRSDSGRKDPIAIVRTAIGQMDTVRMDTVRMDTGRSPHQDR